MRALMLSAVTYLADPAEPDAIDRLADTLSVLVSGVAGGLVGDAVIVAGRESEAVAAVAEATGATLVLHRGGNPYAAGAVAARRDWILCLEAGDVPAEGWIRTLDRFVGTARPETALGRLHRPAGVGSAASSGARRPSPAPGRPGPATSSGARPCGPRARSRAASRSGR